MKLHFLGGVDTVTGSQHIVEAGGAKVLRDCGLFQGRRAESKETNSRLPFSPGDLRSVVLSHAHIDHCGNLPMLARQGYRGPIHATTATASLCGIMLRDAAHIQEQDAAYLNQKTNRRGLPPIEPLYTAKDTEDALELFRGHRYHDPVEVAPGVTLTSFDAGHILGAELSLFTVARNGARRRVGFAFDLGRRHLPLLRDPEPLEDLDVLVLESTYGDRVHADAGRAEEQLREVVKRTHDRAGKVLIPSFALERAQEIIYHLVSLVERGRLPEMPVYVDSPMATALSTVFDQNAEYLDAEYHALRSKVGRVLQPRWLTYTASVEESKRVTSSERPCIVIAASGMCEHGRILHHLKHGISNPRNTVVIVGFQAPHTLGRRLVNGDATVRIFGDEFERKAEVVTLNAFSAHADRDDLVAFARGTRAKKVFLVHGEQDQRGALAEKLKEAGFDQVFLPSRGDVVEL